MKKRGDLTNGLPPDDGSEGGGYELRPAELDRAAELELIDAAFLGDKQAFSELFEHYRPDLYTLCHQRLDDPSLAEDVVQEVFIRALTRLPTFDRSKRFWPWLATIAFRMCTDLQRRRSFTHYSGDIEVSMDTGIRKNGIESHTGSALDEVIASEDRIEFWKSLDVLPERQRRVFLSYTLDGMSCPDIAAAEGISVGLVHVLLFRARKKMRSVHQSRPLPAIVLPFTWLGWKLQRTGERIRVVLGVYSDGFASACVQAVCLGTVVAMVVAASRPAESLERDELTRSGKTVFSATQPRLLETASLRTAVPNIGSLATAPVASQPSVAEVEGSLVDRVINPHESATPETSAFYSITASPNYESDHTILASGNLVFASHDGGANWKPMPSRLLMGTMMSLPPGYPQDQRIFTLGTDPPGLQRSDDGGEVFKLVSPLLGYSLAISPSLGSGAFRTLAAGGHSVFEYDADTGITQPASLALPLSSEWGYQSIAFSPGYRADSTIFVSTRYGKGTLGGPRYDHQSLLYRCEGSVCNETQLPFPGPLQLRLSPRFDQDGLAYAFTTTRLLFSNDGAQTFREIPIPGGHIEHVAILWNKPSGPAIFFSVPSMRLGHSVYRSFDEGASWNSTRFNIPGFEYGSAGLVVTPTGRLITAGRQSGIACSEDNGATWHPRCPPEK